MNIQWIIEDFHPDNGFDRLAEEASRQGIECHVYNTNDPDVKFDSLKYLKLNNSNHILLQSSFQFRNYVGVNKYNPYNKMFTPKNYECTNYYKHFGFNLLNSEYVIMTVSETLRNINFLEEILGEKETGRIFIRPNSGLKPISGMVYINRFPHFVNDWSFVQHEMNQDDLLIIAKAKQIKAEWRIVVIDGKPVTGSLYRNEGFVKFETVNENTDPDLFAFASQMVNIYQPDLVYTMDIASEVDSNKKYSLLELNSFPHAGLYTCDMSIIVNEIKNLIKRWRG